MTQPEFQNAMKLLFETFGTAEYQPGRVKLIFDDCSDLSEFEFRSIVKHFCKTKSVKYPPLPSHFNEEAQGQRKLRTDRQVERTVKEAGERPDGKLAALLDQIGASNAFEASQKVWAEKNPQPWWKDEK